MHNVRSTAQSFPWRRHRVQPGIVYECLISLCNTMSGPNKGSTEQSIKKGAVEMQLVFHIFNTSFDFSADCRMVWTFRGQSGWATPELELGLFYCFCLVSIFNMLVTVACFQRTPHLIEHNTLWAFSVPFPSKGTSVVCKAEATRVIAPNGVKRYTPTLFCTLTNIQM